MADLRGEDPDLIIIFDDDGTQETTMADLDPQALNYAWKRYVRMSMTQGIRVEDFGEIIQAYLAALPAALPKAEPVGWVDFDTLNFLRYGAYRKARITSYQDDVQTIPLYAAPPAGDDQ